jgi:hypothetical protein
MSCENEKALVEWLENSQTQANIRCNDVCHQQGITSSECLDCNRELNQITKRLDDAKAALQACQDRPTFHRFEVSGHVNFLLVVEPGLGYGGGASNTLDAAVVFKLDSRPDKAFGFQLRDDDPVRRAMFALLREAFVHHLEVITDYDELITPPNQNSIAVRVALTSLPQPGLYGHQLHP